MKAKCLSGVAVLAFVISGLRVGGQAQTFNILFNFDGRSEEPFVMSLIQGRDGNFYGTTLAGGTENLGTVFKITPSGTMTTLYSFCSQFQCSDGTHPYAALVLSTDGNFYGMTYSGGGGNCDFEYSGCGTIFKMAPDGALTTLHRFNLADGAAPWGALIQGIDGAFYGTTSEGGSNCLANGCGTIFRITSVGDFKTIYNFCSLPGCPDGFSPYGALVQASNGEFYGTSIGMVYKMGPSGLLTPLADLPGGLAYGGLTEGDEGTFYGASYEGGVNNVGTIFQLTVPQTLTTLYSFCTALDCTDGELPIAPLVRGTDGNFYGTTLYGGTPFNCNGIGCGTIFSVTPSGSVTTLHSFCAQPGCKDGLGIFGGLFQATNGIFYGATLNGGSNDLGLIYSLDMGLAPFVAFVRDSGFVGGTGGILGQGFTGATKVLLDGAPVEFAIASDTFIKAKVPFGAKTGFVTVTTPSGILTSNKPFHVRPQLLSFDPPSGPPGTQVTITGVSLTQTLGVGFGDRTPAQFTVNSDTSVTATVPQGAKAGKIGIETKGGVAISSGTFEVTTK